MKSTSKKQSNTSTATAKPAKTAKQQNSLSKELDAKPAAATPENQPPQQADKKQDTGEVQVNQTKDAPPQTQEKPDDLKIKTPTPSAEKPVETTKPATTPLTAKLLPVFALLLAGGAVTFSAYTWQQMSQLEQRLQADTNLENETVQTAGQQTQHLTNRLDIFQRKLESLQAELDTVSQGDKQTDLIADLYNNPKTDMLPLSISALLTSAELHITLSNSVQPLLTTLTSIDNHLKASGMDDDNMLRQAVKTDIDKIRNHPTPDPITMADKINTLINQIEQDSALLSAKTQILTPPPEVELSIDINLTDAPAEAQTTQDSSTWDTIKNTSGWLASKASEIGSATWDQLGSLVQVTPLNHDAQQIFLSFNESAVLRENIKLRLISARITVLQGQYEQANKELSDVRTVIETYFDNQKAAPILQRINNLSAELKNTTFPQPVHTIAALKTLQSNQ